MDTNLTLSAQSLTLASDLEHSEAVHGLRVVKNVSAKTYLRVTSAEWRLLELFSTPCTVPAALAQALDERVCLPLGEFYELILKAVREHILVEPGALIPSSPVYAWRVGIRPRHVIRPLAGLVITGIVLAFAFQPLLPTSVLGVLAGLITVSAALSLGAAFAACIVRGGGGELYHPHWNWWSLPPCFEVDTGDVVMLSTPAQQAVVMARTGTLAAAAGIMTWQKPEWSFFPLLALAINLRPIFGGRFHTLFRFSHKVRLSDAEHAYIFPPNQRPQMRWRTLRLALRHPDTWVRVAYGVIWTLALIYAGGRLTDTPPWTFGFWETNGSRIALAIGASLMALGGGYLAWEFYYFLRRHALALRRGFRLWKQRWWSGRKLVLLEGARLKAVADSPLFRSLPPPERQQLARVMQSTHHGAWHALPEYGPAPVRVSLIVSGTVGLYRRLPSGRLRRVQVLAEGDVVGLQDLADPGHPDYFVRTLSPVTLLTLDRVAAEEIAVHRMLRSTLGNTILKLPFLRRISLCQNWHVQAVERFAHLSTITDFPDGGVIFPEDQFNQEFFIIFERDALVSRNTRRVAVIHAGDFFGEIGLLQNSTSNARVSAKQGTRCLSISRVEFLRFVTHNYTVALELERVSSKRLGRPIFPLEKGNFRAT